MNKQTSRIRSSTGDDGTISTENEKTGVFSDTTKFRDETGQKKKKTSTKVTRENVKESVNDDGVDPEWIKMKFDQPLRLGLKAPAVGSSSRCMEVRNSGGAKTLTVGQGRGASPSSQCPEWFSEMMMQNQQRFEKFRQEHSEKRNSAEIRNQYWDNCARDFRKAMEKSGWGMQGDSEWNGNLSISSGNNKQERLSSSSTGDVKQINGNKSTNGLKIEEIRKNRLSSSSDEQSERRSVERLEGGSGTKLEEISFLSGGGRLSRPSIELLNNLPKGVMVGKPTVKKTTNTYQYSSSKTSYQCNIGDKKYSYNKEHVNEAFEHSVEEEDSEDDDDDNEVLPDDSDIESIVAPSELMSIEPSELASVQSHIGGLILPSETPQGVKPGAAEEEKNTYYLYRIALEVLTTERSYVEKLHLIDQVLRHRVDVENRQHNIFPQEVVRNIFSNLKCIYQLHHDFVLPQLEVRMQEWDKVRRIGDIMVRFAPFLKMYTEYVNNYETSQKTINFWMVKSARFRAIIDEISKMPESRNQCVLNHNIVPVQRVPRYELLLKEYLKRLPHDSPDRADAEKALSQVSSAAHHINNMMRRIDKFRKLLEIKDSLGGAVDLVSPTREFIKEGRIIKISARSGDHQDRYLYLFSDILLLCSELMVSKRGAKYKIRAKLSVDGLQVVEGDNLETENTFYLKSRVKTIELYTRIPADKSLWMEALSKTIAEYKSKHAELHISDDMIKLEDDELGRKAPSFVKDTSVGKCMNCKSAFSIMKKRKSCRACGLVLCSKCIHGKLPLPYDNYKPNKVCGKCYATINTVHKEKESALKVDVKPEQIQLKRGCLQVNAQEPGALMADSLLLRTKGKGKTWAKRWFTLRPDFVLYSYKSNNSESALTSMPLPGFTVSPIDKSDNIDKANVFKLFHKKKVYYFQTDSKDKMNRWIQALDRASKAEAVQSVVS